MKNTSMEVMRAKLQMASAADGIRQLEAVARAQAKRLEGRTVIDEVVNGSSIPVPEKPKQVWLVLNRDSVAAGNKLVHHENALIEDQIHDWYWKNGKLTYNAHSCEKGEVVSLVLVYQDVD